MKTELEEKAPPRRIDAAKQKLSTERGKRVKLARMLVELTRKDIDERYSISQHTIHAWEKGTNCLTEKNAERLVEVFSREGLAITKDWLLYGTDLQLSTSVEPKGKNKELQDALNITGDFKILNEVNFFLENNNNSISAMITDEALLPIFCVGDYVGGINVDSAYVPNLVGEFCIITDSEGRILIKKVFSHHKNNSFLIGNINPLFNAGEPAHFVCDIHSAAKITRHWRLGRAVVSQI